MKKHMVALLALLLPLWWAGNAGAAGTASPSAFTVVRGQSNTVVVTYVFSGVPLRPGPTGTFTSPVGVFAVGGTEVGRINQPVTVTIVAGAAAFAPVGAGTVSETIVVPVGVMDRALQQGSRTFTFSRQFPFPVPVTISVEFTIGSEATASFAIRRIEVYFENHRAETTVPKDFPKLRAFADLSFVGSGLFQGHWEVDGRVLSQVNQHLSFGRTITIQTPDIPPVPTFDPGTHTLRFVITSPSFGLPLPTLVYFVTPEEFLGAPRALRLLSPEDRQSVAAAPLRFRWERLNRGALYLVQFLASPDGKPVFSAYTRDPTYSLPGIVLEEVLVPKQTYYWKVTGFDAQNRTIGESGLRAFTPERR